MTRIVASAPGKLVLSGDYAVLAGAPALVLAVNRRARVELEPRNDSAVVIAAPDLGITAARATIADAGDLRWHDAATATRLALVDHVWSMLAAIAAAPRRGVALRLDSSGFFIDSNGGNRKLGLGSSAALAVALAAALLRAGGRTLQPDSAWCAHLIECHRDWQGGRGSGVDIAASLAGGLIRYRRDATEITPLGWPPAGCALLFVWSGQSVSTADSLARLAAWRAADPAAYAARMAALVARADAVAAAVDGDGAGFVATLAAYAAGLRQLAQASGIAIFSPAQERALAIAEADGAAFKPCGAGGDLGVVVCASESRRAALRRAIMGAGLRAVELDIDPRGVRCDDRDAST